MMMERDAHARGFLERLAAVAGAFVLVAARGSLAARRQEPTSRSRRSHRHRPLRGRRTHQSTVASEWSSVCASMPRRP